MIYIDMHILSPSFHIDILTFDIRVSHTHTHTCISTMTDKHDVIWRTFNIWITIQVIYLDNNTGDFQ